MGIREKSFMPEGYRSLTPWMIGQNTADLMEFLARAFDAEPHGDPVMDAQGGIGHAEMTLGDSIVMMFDKPDWPPTPAFLRLYLPDVAASVQRAVEAGGTVVTEATHMPWGDIVARVADPFGNLYWIQSKVEDVTEQELQRRWEDEAFTTSLEYVQGSLYSPFGKH